MPLPAARTHRPAHWQNMGGRRNVFTSGRLGALDAFGKRLARSDLRELDQHGQVDAGNDLDTGPAHHGDGEVAGRSSEHVGQQDDAIAAVDLGNARLDIGSVLLNVVVRADADRRDVPLRTDHVLHGKAHLLGEAAVGHENKTYHLNVLRPPDLPQIGSAMLE